MKILIKKAKIIDIESLFHNQIVDLKIDNGTITEININIESTAEYKLIEIKNLHISQGWFDSSVSFGEPGFEERETIENGLMVAAKSGFTAVCVQPNTRPISDNQAQIQFLKIKSNGFATDLFPIGAFSKNSDGKDLAELYDMKNAGAIAFGDYKQSVDNSNLLKIGLQYVQDFDGLLIPFCENKDIKAGGLVNESAETIHLGLKGIPNLAEEIDLIRNLFLLEYTGGKMHIPTISTAKSVELIRKAKAKGLNVSCSVAIHNLILTDVCLHNFETKYKLSPPLRTSLDSKSLINGILDNTIDMITSDHNPIDIENKQLEFDVAKDGSIGLESAFSSLATILPLDVIIQKFTSSKKIFGLETTPIAVDNKANITLFSPSKKYIFSSEHILSKSKNSAFVGMDAVGEVHGIINNNQLILKKL